jgi:hypothetical protein
VSDQSENLNSERVADDILRGATQIAAELGVKPEDVYYLARVRKYPIARLGKILIASKQQLRRAHRAMTQRPA